MKRLIYTIILATISIILIGCKAKTVYVPVESVKTKYRDRLERDSIYLYDSVFVERWKNNDTVFLTKEKYKYLYRDKLVRDTICKTDSIAVPYPVIETKEVNRLTSFQSFQLWCGRIILILIFSYFVFKYIKKKIL